MTYGELQKNINDGRVSGAKVEIHIDRYETTYHDISLAALKKIIAAALKKEDITTETRCIWGFSAGRSNATSSYYVKLNY